MVDTPSKTGAGTETRIDPGFGPVYDKLDVMTQCIADLARKMERWFAAGDYKTIAVNLTANVDQSFGVPHGTAGLLLLPRNGSDLTNVTVRCGPFVFTFPAGTTNPRFVPFLPLINDVRLIPAANINLEIVCLDPHSAQIFAQAGSETIFAQLTGSSATIGQIRVQDGTSAALAAVLNLIGDGYAQATGLAVRSAQAGFNGATMDLVRVGNGVLHTAQNAALANLATLVLWTPAAGKKFRALSLAVYAGTAGHYQIGDGATVYDIYFGVGWNPLPLASNGFFSAAANNVLGIVNQVGAAAVVAAIAQGTEE